MHNYINKLFLAILTFSLSACSAFYEDQILPPTQQELAEHSILRPREAIKDGIFHMQRTEAGSTVRVQDKITLKRPDLPLFDVAYISRNVESILLELSNAAGESVTIPQGLRGRSVTIVHSGADFQEMLSLVLSKVGYHYNYIDGIWNITRYPIRNYILEIGQSKRKGGLTSSSELAPEISSSGSSSGGSLDTDYNDDIWTEVETTLNELIQIGKSQTVGGTSSNGNLDISTADVSNEEETQGTAIFGSLNEEGGLTPNNIEEVTTTDHLTPEETAEPWLRITSGVGMITVRAAPEAHRIIEEYLDKVQESALKQVLVEVRVIAVIKDRTTDRGVNFTRDINSNDNSILSTIGFQSATPLSDITTSGTFLSAFSKNGAGQNDMTAIVQAISTLGNVYTISSPSLLSRNNQISRVSVTRQLGYAETEVEQNTTTNGDIVIGSRTDTAQFKNAGTVLSVFPFIGKNKVQLRLRLAVASKSGDTAIQTTVGDTETVTNFVPEMSNNVVDQDMVLEYGRVYAIGGLIETSTGFDKDYIPGLDQVPGMSEIFQRAKSRKQDTEFIVLLRVSRS